MLWPFLVPAAGCGWRAAGSIIGLVLVVGASHDWSRWTMGPLLVGW